MILHSRFLLIYLLLCLTTRLRDESTGVRVAVEARSLGIIQNAHNVSEAHPPSYLMSNWGSFIKVQLRGREGGHLPPSLGLMHVSGQLIFALLPSHH
jgi:hypothetical protein